MVKLTIDGTVVEAKEGSTLLTAARTAGIDIPTLCFLKDINEIGACRICLVEIEGNDRLAASCNTVVEDGIVVHTNSPKVLAARKTNLELILSEHNTSCTTCIRSGSCELQKLAEEFGLVNMPYSVKAPEKNWDDSFPLIRDESKCIKCMRCVQVCDKVQGLGIWDINGTGARTSVGVAGGVNIRATDCSLCGQCITHCPVGALHERDDLDRVREALADENTVTVIQIAPAVRAAWGESMGLEREEATVNRLAAALRKVGFNYIFDTDFTADLTIMEEGSELLGRLANKDSYSWPMFTSCCPGWIRFIKSQYPEFVPNLSTAKSPQQMFGAVIKSYFAEKAEIPAEKIFSVSVMPCTAKKHECDIPVMNSAGAGNDVDVVLTTREVTRLLKSFRVDAASLEESPFDSIMGESTGAGVIFGATGGVMEAALRSAYYLVNGKNPDADAFKDVRGTEGWREIEYELGGAKLRLAVASGLGNVRKLMDALKSGKVSYDFVEIMACPGGCAGGGGQPICSGFEPAALRGATLYDLDAKSALRFSHENPDVLKAYEDYFKKPLSEVSHHLLHTDHKAWKMPNED